MLSLSEEFNPKRKVYAFKKTQLFEKVRTCMHALTDFSFMKSDQLRAGREVSKSSEKIWKTLRAAAQSKGGKTERQMMLKGLEVKAAS